MIFLNTLSYLALVYLTYLFIRAIVLPYAYKLIFEYKEKQLLKKGNKKFYYEKNKVIVYAHTQEQANAKYKNMKSNLKTKKNAILEQNRK